VLKKTARITELNVLWHSTGLSVFFLPVLCFFLVRATMVDKTKAVVCRLIATSATMLSEKKRKEGVKCEVRSGI